MKNSTIILSSVMLSMILLSGFTFKHDKETDIKGVWIRVNDKLRIEVSEENKDILHSFIIAEGNEKFPCDVNGLPIYKNIVKAGRNLWRCDFLVVTLGSCSTEYEEGIIQITKQGIMQITCPGFEKKIYTKAKPRYEAE